MTNPTALSFLASFNSKDTGLTVTLSDGATYNLNPLDTNYTKALKAFTDKDVTAFVDIVDPKRRVASFLEKSANGRIKLEHGVITDDTGMELSPYLIDHILWMAETDVASVQPLLNFAARLQLNPTYSARMELGQWMQKARMPITEDGCFIAYKKVKDDYTSIYDGKTLHAVGTTVEMPGGRGAVDDNRQRTCSKGLHFCSIDYLPSFGANDSGTRVLLMKIDPADVVAIPVDYSFTKGRAAKYTIIADVTEQLRKDGVYDAKMFANTPVYTSEEDYDEDAETDEDDEYEFYFNTIEDEN